MPYISETDYKEQIQHIVDLQQELAEVKRLGVGCGDCPEIQRRRDSDRDYSKLADDLHALKAELAKHEWRDVGIKDKHGDDIKVGDLVREYYYIGTTDTFHNRSGVVVYEPEAWSYLIEDENGDKWHVNPYAEFTILLKGKEL